MNNKIITLTSDFGLKDSYVGSMKGVILSLIPDIEIIDLCHTIHPQDVHHGAFVLHTGYSYFPAGTIHIAVVDPGVGSTRRAITLQTDKYIFLAPDNGLLSYIFRDEQILSIRNIENKNLFRDTISPTFHGRDIFAPVAAHIAQGIALNKIGPKIDNPIKLSLSEPVKTNGQIITHIVCIDQFGNLITDITQKYWNEHIGNRRFFILCGKRIEKINQAYSESPENEILAIFNSSGYLEISSYRGNAAQQLNMQPGNEIEIDID